MIDGGRFGQPSVSLKIRLHKGDKKVPLPSNEDELDEFTLTWNPGVKIQGNWMMEEYGFKVSDKSQKAVVLKKFKLEENSIDRFMAIHFKSMVHMANASEIESTEGLDKDIAKALRELFTNTGTYQIGIMFLNTSQIDDREVLGWDIELFPRGVRAETPAAAPVPEPKRRAGSGYRRFIAHQYFTRWHVYKVSKKEERPGCGYKKLLSASIEDHLGIVQRVSNLPQPVGDSRCTIQQSHSERHWLAPASGVS